MTDNLETRTYVRQAHIDGIGPWVWTTGEEGAWSGPKQDWEKSHKNVLNLVRHKRVVIQAGGNQGMYPRLLAEHFRNVYTFEPDPMNFYCLTRNCTSSNIFKYQAALGKDHFTTELDRSQTTNSGQHTIKETPGPIPVLKIDDFNITDVDMIWLDIEGYEHKALQGGMQLITTYKPVIMVERGGCADIKNLLTPLGYKEATRSVSDTVWVA